MDSDEQRPESLVRGYTGRMFLLLTITFITIKITQRMLPPLLPEIISDLGITTFLAGIALSLLTLTRASMQFPAGRISDQLSRTSVLLPSLGFIIVGLGILSFSIEYGMFLAGIFFFGIGLGMFDPAARSMVTDLFVEKRGRAFGLHLTGGDVAGVLAAGLAIWIVAISTWRGAFFPLLILLLPAPVFLYAWSNESLAISAVKVDIVSTVVRLLQTGKMRRLMIAYSMFVFGITGIVGFLPTFLTEVHGFSFALASSSFAVIFAVGMIAKPVSGTMSDSYPRLTVVIVGLLFGIVGVSGLVTAPTQFVALGAVVVYAVGQAAVPPALQAYLMDQFQDETVGGDFGVVRMTYMVAGSIGPAYIGYIASVAGFIPAFTSMIFVFLGSSGLLLWLRLQ